MTPCLIGCIVSKQNRKVQRDIQGEKVEKRQDKAWSQQLDHMQVHIYVNLNLLFV